ncbi:MAG: glycerol-3-phosphate 1-O-acyltransferase PlsY [Coriobacteriia bacterium]|nr:glycerol-3-phosphate 1-O-acyltransferase PlsY [Coriobacteriia bacterium]
MDKILFFSAIAFLLSFLLGSIPWGVIISRLFYRQDIREHGSGNIGTTNAFRTMGAVGGVAVFCLDFLKGILAGFISMVLAVMLVVDLSASGTEAIVIGSAKLVIFGKSIIDAESLAVATTHAFGLVAGVGFFGAICGHVFSPWLKFKGGKGIAVAAGALFFAFGPISLVVLASVFALLTIVTRYVSVGSISAALVAPFVAAWAMHGEPFFIGMVCLSASLVIWAHRGNIARLRAGNENRIGAKKDALAKEEA